MPLPTDVESPDQVDALNAQAWRCRHSDTRRALSLTRRALASAEAIGYRLGRAMALLRMAVCEFILAEPVEPRDARLAEAVDELEHLGDAAGLAEALNLSGIVQGSRGRHEAAVALHTRCLGLRESLGDLGGQAASLSNLALAWRRLGRFDEARASLDRSAGLAEVAGDHRSLAYATVNLGALQLAQADDAEPGADPPAADGAWACGVEDAAGSFERGYTLATRTEDLALGCTALTGLALARMRQRRWGPAEALLRQAHEQAQRVGNAGDLLRVQLAAAELARRLGRPQQAEAQLRALFEPLRRCHDPDLAPQLWLELAQCQLDDGRPLAARDSLARGRDLIEAGHAPVLGPALARLTAAAGG